MSQKIDNIYFKQCYGLVINQYTYKHEHISTCSILYPYIMEALVLINIHNLFLLNNINTNISNLVITVIDNNYFCLNYILHDTNN